MSLIIKNGHAILISNAVISPDKYNTLQGTTTQLHVRVTQYLFILYLLTVLIEFDNELELENVPGINQCTKC